MNILVILFILNTPLSDLYLRHNYVSYKTGCSMTISSANRTLGHNVKVGGSSGSLHISNEKALDLVKKECKFGYVYLGFLYKLYFNGVIVYPNHIHVDLRDTGDIFLL